MVESSVFEFQDLESYLSAMQQANGKLRSLRQWASRLGYRSPRSIAMVFKGQRLPSQEMLLRWGRIFRLTQLEQVYVETLVSLERNRRAKKDLQPSIKALQTLSPRLEAEVEIGGNDFAHIASWYFFALWQLVGTSDFREDLTWIRRRLRDKVTREEIKAAIATLVQLGILCREGKNLILKSRAKHLRTTTDIPSQAIRNHHVQMALRSLEAVREQAVDEREFTSVTFRCDPKRMPEAKKVLRDFRDAFHKKFATEVGTEVFQFNLQLFAHTSRGHHGNAGPND